MTSVIYAARLLWDCPRPQNPLPGSGFRLEDIRQPVYMRHSKADDSCLLMTAEMTSNLLPRSVLEVRQNDAPLFLKPCWMILSR